MPRASWESSWSGRPVLEPACVSIPSGDSGRGSSARGDLCPPGRSRHLSTAPAAPWRGSTTAAWRATARPPYLGVSTMSEVPGGRVSSVGAVGGRAVGRRGGGVLGLYGGTAALGGQLLKGSPGETARKDVAVLPATDGREGHTQGVSEAFLGETCTMPPRANELAGISGRPGADAGVGGIGGVELHSEVHLGRAMSNACASPKAQ